MKTWECVDEANEDFYLAFSEKLKNSLNSTGGNKVDKQLYHLIWETIVFIIHMCYNLDVRSTYTQADKV